MQGDPSKGVVTGTEMKEKFSDKFEVIGKMSEVQVKLHINTDVTPVAQKGHHITFYLREALDKELDSLLERDFIEPAEGANSWISPLVVVLKPKRINICLYNRAANVEIE